MMYSPTSTRNKKSSKSTQPPQGDGGYKNLLSTRKKNIERLNANQGEDSGDYDAGYYGDDDNSDGSRHYKLTRTSRIARSRRAKGL